MRPPPHQPVRTDLFTAIGLSPEEAAVYEAILNTGADSVGPLSESTGMTPTKTQVALRRLEEKGLVRRAAGKSARFVVTAPQGAIDDLLRERERELEEVRSMLGEIEKRYRSMVDAAETSALIEVLTGREAIAREFLRFENTVVEEVLGFDKPPYVVAPDDHAAHESQVLARGVRCEVVYDQAALAEVGASELVFEGIRRGEVARVHHNVPLKLGIFDRRAALVPFGRSEQQTLDAALLVHASSLLDALIALWTRVWEQAVPLVARNGAVDVKADSVDDSQDRLISLLLAGMKTSVIARELGIGVSTAERRVKELMHRYGAQTRVQLGYKLAQMMSAAEHPDDPAIEG